MSEDSEMSGESEDTLHGQREDTPSLFSDFMKQLQEEATAEGKIRLSMDFMRAALSHSGSPRFKDFWEGRKICLPLFKENISPKLRSQLWSSYIELSIEAKRLKEILDEQAAFAVEQIELAIQALERDLEHYALILSQSQDFLFPCESISLKNKAELYGALQKELTFLSTLAARVNGMRKEVVKTEMRIRVKNKFLERLSLCGDRVFPKRKELVKQISQVFTADVGHFVESHFRDEEFHGVPLYALREEIKHLQLIAKALALNTHAFTETRLKLSGCWDKVKQREKERKKETQQKRQAFKQNFDLVMEKIKPFAEACTTGISLEECNKLFAEILDFMKTLELGRDEVRALKEELHKARRTPLDREREADQERQKKEREAELLRREKMEASKAELGSLLAQIDAMELETLVSRRDGLLGQFEQLKLSKAERHIVDRLFKQLKEGMEEKKEKALLLLSEDDLKARDQLKAVLEERKQRRQEIKEQLEQYRKLLGGSGFDFEKAMMYREMIEAEKAALEKVHSSIEDIEEKIEEIEG